MKTAQMLSDRWRSSAPLVRSARSLAALAFAAGSFLCSSTQAQITGEQVISGDNGGWSLGWTQANNGRLYHLGDLYGIYRSDDRGQTWTQPLRGFQSDEEWIGYGVAVVPSNANKVYYLGGNRVTRSLDGGETWPVYTTISREGIGRSRGANQLVLKPGTEDEIWVVARRSATQKATLIRSIDGGLTFSDVGGATFDSDFRIAKNIQFRPTNPNHVWVGTTNGLYVSTDGGSNWGLVAGTSGRSISAVGLSKVPGNNIAIIAAPTWGRSVNATNWNDVSTYSLSFLFDNGGKGSNGHILALRNGDFLLSDSTRNVMRITPNGDPNNIKLIQSTRNTPAPGQFPAWLDLAKEQAKGDNWGREELWQDVSQDNTIYSDGGAGPSISTDLALETMSWSFICKGVRGVVTRKPVLVEGNSNLAIFPCNDKGVMVHNDGGNSDSLSGIAKKDIDYEKLYVMNNVTAFGNGQILYAGGANQGGAGSNFPMVLKSTNFGTNWSALTATGLPNSPARGLGNVIADIVVDKDNSNDLLVLMGEDYGSVHRSTDGGATFGPALGGINAVQTGAQDFKSSFLMRDGVLSNRRYLAVRTRDSRPDFFVSDDKGATWAPRARPFGDPSGFSVDPKIAGKLWLGTNFDLHTSNDGGLNWIKVDNFQGVVSLDAFNGRVLMYARRNNAPTFDLWFSPDNGATWQQLTNSTWRFPSGRNPDTVTRWTFTLDPNRTDRFWVSGLSGAAYTFNATGTGPSAPSITSNPSNVSVPVGSSANFIGSASGNPTPTYQWQRLPTGSSTWSNLSIGGSYSGVTSGTLTVSSTTTGMSGDQFRLVASNSQGTATSSAATLTVTTTVGAAISSNPSNSSVTAGSNASFSVSVTGNPTPTIQWQRQPSGSTTWSNLSNTGSYSGVTTGTLTVASTTALMSGDQFRAVATNSGGTATSSAATLTVNTTPAITTQPAGSTVTAGANATFTVAVSGSPTPTIQWQRQPSGSTTWSNLSNTGSYSGVTTGTLTVASTTTTMSGDQFRAVGTNSAGSVTSNAAVLTVNPVTSGSNNGTGLRGQYFNNMTLTGSPVLTRTDATVNFAWGSGSPAAGVNSDGFSVRWQGEVEAPVAGSFTFTTVTDDGVRLWVNGTQIINQWINQGPTPLTGSITLAAGTKYSITMEYFENGGGADARLSWSYPGQATVIIPQTRLYPAGTTVTAPSITSALTSSVTVNTSYSYTITASNSPTSYNATGLPAGLSVNTSTGVISGTPTATGTSNITISATNSGGTGSATLALTVNAASGGSNNGTGLRGQYFSNMTLAGSPALTRTDATVNFDWGSGSPGSPIGVDGFSVRWEGEVEAPTSGSYTFSTETDDGVRLWVNGTQIIDQWINQAPTVVNGSAVTLTGGTKYTIRMEYFENGGGASSRLRWSYPGQATTIIPQTRLYPAGTTVTAPSITSALTSSVTVNTGYSYTITASNSPTSYNATGLPAGLSVNTSTGVISGTPTATGTSNITISATNSGGSGSATLVLTVNAAGGGGGSALAYEGFSYTAGATALANANGGTGWGGAWAASNQQVTSPGSTYSSGGTMSVSGLKATVNANNSISRTLGATYSSGTYWLAFIINTKSSSQEAGVYLSSSGNDRFFIGRRSNGAPYVIRSQINFNVGQTSISSGTSTLLVVKLVLGAGNDSALLWVNPSLSGTPSDASAQASISDIGDLSFNAVKLSSGSFNDSLDIDEIRLGSSFQSVAPLQ